MQERADEIEARLRDVETKMTTHEAICSERYRQIIEGASRLADELKGTNALIRTVGLLLVAGMAGVIISQVMPA